MSQWESSSNGYGYGYGYGSNNTGQYGEREPGARRRKLAAMAKSVYQASVATASEIRNQYDNTRIRGVVDVDDESYKVSIPGSFPDVAIVTKGEEQMVLFPSYAKRHVRQFRDDDRQRSAHFEGERREAGLSEEDYWRDEWARAEDKKAVVDVDVRGWVYAPHKGPMTRKNRVLIGLARRLSGIPAATHQAAGQLQDLKTGHEEREDMKEQQKIDKEAEAIEKRYRDENEAAVRGGYSETPKEDDSEGEGRISPSRTRSGSNTPMSMSSSPRLSARSNANGTSTGLTDAELAVANANLMARLGPFLTTPLVQLAVTLFFYNDQRSVSRTVMTNDAGHFTIRAALEFVPTHVRVLANEDLSAVHEVEIIDEEGVSLISDIDDTVKKSSISLGAREIFRNTFIRDLKELAVDGVREWYSELHKMGVSFHYCSNSPWQLFPVIATFFRYAGLPPGSLHLKQYSGMLQGIFEPVAERKKGTLERILRDFPKRKFILVGDSGEADLEVYTDLALANPKRILAIFIRDVTTPEQPGYFDAAFGGPLSSPSSTRRPSGNPPSRQDSRSDDPTRRPALPPRTRSEPPGQPGPDEGDLIDFSDEPQEMDPVEQEKFEKLNGRPSATTDLQDLSIRRKPAPPRPIKPAALKSESSNSFKDGQSSAANGGGPPVPPKKSLVTQAKNAIPHPLTQMQNSSQQQLGSSPSLSPNTGSSNTATNSSTPNISSSHASSPNSVSATKSNKQAPPPPPPRRRATPSSLSPGPHNLRHSASNSEIDNLNLNAPDSAPGPRPPSRTNTATFDSILGATTGHSMQQGGQNIPVNKKLELWRRRLQRAHEILDSQGVMLYTWRKGEDVGVEAVSIVREALKRSVQGGRK